MPEIQIRFATVNDAGAVADIHAGVARAAYRGLVPQTQLDSVPIEKRTRHWLEAIEYGEPQVQLALEADEPVGFVGYDRSRDPKSRPTTGEIWALYVRESHWGRGVGVALWDAACDGLREEGCTEVTVWVPLANERALRFYGLAGFKRETNTARSVRFGEIRLEEVRLRRGVA